MSFVQLMPVICCHPFFFALPTILLPLFESFLAFPAFPYTQRTRTALAQNPQINPFFPNLTNAPFAPRSPLLSAFEFLKSVAFRSCLPRTLKPFQVYIIACR